MEEQQSNRRRNRKRRFRGGGGGVKGGGIARTVLQGIDARDQNLWRQTARHPTD